MIILPFVEYGSIEWELKQFKDKCIDFEYVCRKIKHIQDQINDLKKFLNDEKNIGLCCLCKKTGLTLINHHYSYYPEATILVCISCHSLIHKSTEKDVINKLRPSKEDADKFYKVNKNE